MGKAFLSIVHIAENAMSPSLTVSFTLAPYTAFSLHHVCMHARTSIRVSSDHIASNIRVSSDHIAI